MPPSSPFYFGPRLEVLPVYPVAPVVFVEPAEAPLTLVWTLEPLGNDPQVCHVRVGLPDGKSSVLGIGRDKRDAQGALDNLISDLEGWGLDETQARGVRERVSAASVAAAAVEKEER